MKLGLVSAIFPELPLEQVLAYAREEAFECIEVMCWPVGKADRKYAGVTHIDVAGFSQSRADDLNALSAKYGVAFSGLGYYPNPLDPDLAVAKGCVEHIKKVILAAEKLGLKNINTFAGRDWSKSVEDNWPRFLKTWRPLVSFAEDHDIRIGIENCPMLYTADEWPGGKNLATTPTIWRRMFADIPSRNFGLNYDPSHFVLQQMDPASPIREFQNRIFHVHAKDLKIHPARLNQVGIFTLPVEWCEPRIPGYGEMNWNRFMSALMEAHFRGPVCIEVEDETFGNAIDDRKAAARVAANVLRPFFPKL
ncbi:MAG TPA: sugar phosphate isomerase/epimerase [Verrucomicrobiae bacterium]